MSEKKKATLCLSAIALLIVCVQTADYSEQQEAQAAAHPSADYIAWHREMLAATSDTWTREEREAYIARWSAENPDLAPIINTQWKTRKVAQK